MCVTCMYVYKFYLTSDTVKCQTYFIYFTLQMEVNKIIIIIIIIYM